MAKEKEFTRLRDQLSQQRRALPWVKVDKEYVFDGPNGKETLAELFAGRSQLLVYHFMFGPDWDEGCKSCSFWADNYDDIIVHLRHRDVTMVTISRAPLSKLAAYQQRMGWGFKWVSSFGNDFNWDYHVSFTPEQEKQGEMYYNYLSQHMHEVSAIVFAGIEGRFEKEPAFVQASMYGSVLPSAWSFMLALRARGVGSAWTTLALMHEKELAKVLGIPDTITLGVMMPIGYYTGTDFKPAKRLPARGRTHWNSWGQPR